MSVTGFAYHAMCQISILDNDCYAKLYLQGMDSIFEIFRFY